MRRLTFATLALAVLASAAPASAQKRDSWSLDWADRRYRGPSIYNYERPRNDYWWNPYGRQSPLPYTTNRERNNFFGTPSRPWFGLGPSRRRY